MAQGFPLGQGTGGGSRSSAQRAPRPAPRSRPARAHPGRSAQPAPAFPFNLKREAITGQVRVEFVVDTEGRVHHAFVVESSHSGFDEAALTGVSRWRFRPGYKNGRKVNTRMQVPIVFRIVDDME